MCAFTSLFGVYFLPVANGVDKKLCKRQQRLDECWNSFRYLCCDQHIPPPPRITNDIGEIIPCVCNNNHRFIFLSQLILLPTQTSQCIILFTGIGRRTMAGSCVLRLVGESRRRLLSAQERIRQAHHHWIGDEERPWNLWARVTDVDHN